jgi:hypothetical protein
MAIENPTIWAATATVSTAAATIAGVGFRAWREHIRAGCRLASLREALRDTAPADRADILRALADLEGAPDKGRPFPAPRPTPLRRPRRRPASPPGQRRSTP